jgi:hypothetical protein
MAEIRVQEKRGSLAWLWVLLLALLVGAGVWWWMTTQDPGPARAPATADTVSLRMPMHTGGVLLSDG